MVRILYDYDIRTLLQGKFYNINLEKQSKIDAYFIDNLLIQGHHIYNFNFIGGGSDSVTIIDNESMSFYIIEPINGIVFAYEMILVLKRYEEESLKKKEFNFSIFMDETIFRHHRNDDEYFVIGKILNEDNNIRLQFKYPNTSIEFNCDYISFVIELLSFCDKMLEFHLKILPNFKQYPWYNIFNQAFDFRNVLREKYSVYANHNTKFSFLDELKTNHPL